MSDFGREAMLRAMSETQAEYTAQRETADGDTDDVEALALNALALADGDEERARRLLAEALLRLAHK